MPEGVKGPNNANLEKPQISPNTAAESANPVLNTIFDVDLLGNNDGKLEEQDFIIALKQDKYMNLKTKIENFYVEFAGKNLGKTKEVGNYLITEVDLPLQPKGVTNKRKIIKDKSTGRIISETSTLITEGNDGVTTVKTHRKRYGGTSIIQNDVEFQYNKEALENYIINDAKDNNGNSIKYFSDIPEIRKVPEALRTEEQQKLLDEFDNLIKYSIEAGTDYRMDPKFVIAIIQQEVGFQGLSKRVTGANGKGYMQLTSAPIKDFLGYAADGRYHSLKTGQYGPEMEELLISRGFETSMAATSFAKSSVYKDVYNYLKENKDPEFNIRLGTLILRLYTDKANGNVKTAARNYNGSPHKEKYSVNVARYNNLLQDTVPRDTTYVYKRIPRR